MKFGKEFTIHLEQTLPEWRDKFLCYKPLKKLLKNFPNTLTAISSPSADPSLNFLPTHQRPIADGAAGASSSASVGGQYEIGSRSLVDLQDWFVRILNEELEKFNDFYVDKEEEFVIRFQELKQRIEHVKENSWRAEFLTSESEFSEEMMVIRRDFVSIHGEMVLLKNYSSLNFAGLIKILKKYDKRTGGVLQLPFTQLAVRQPFFTTESLTRLVRECEANLELLFPLEAEVIESTPTQTDSNPPPNMANISPGGTPSNLGEDTMYLYRSTLAAMKAISGLQKESSTNNPLSFSSLFRRNQDNDSTGAVTDENSAASSSSASLHDEAGDDEEDAHSV